MCVRVYVCFCIVMIFTKERLIIIIKLRRKYILICKHKKQKSKNTARGSNVSQGY